MLRTNIELDEKLVVVQLVRQILILYFYSCYRLW